MRIKNTKTLHTLGNVSSDLLRTFQSGNRSFAWPGIYPQSSPRSPSCLDAWPGLTLGHMQMILNLTCKGGSGLCVQL